MTCREAMDVQRAKAAAMAFAQAHGGSLFRTHAFMTASGYALQGMTVFGGRAYFSYRPDPLTPDPPWAPIEGMYLVRLMTDLDADPLVVAVGP